MSPHPLFRRFCLLALGGVVLAGCSRSEKNASAPAGTEAPGPKEYALCGEVVAFSKEPGKVIVKHDEIPGYMPPMTMEFTFEPADQGKLAEGKRFRARLVDDGQGNLHLRAAEPIDEVKEQQIKAAANLLRQDTAMRGKEAYREIGETVPQFTLYDQNGDVFAINRVRGKWVVLNFIYTRCPIATMCPASTQRMMDLQAAGKKAGRGDLELLSISLDPGYDTPPVLKQYADLRGIDGANFHFLTGPEQAVRDLLRQFGVIVEPGENFLKHTLSTLLINPEGRIVHRVDGTTWSPKEFLDRLPKPAPVAPAAVLASPAAADTGESSLYPGPDGTVYLTWSGPGDREGERTLKLATLAPGAAAWSAPRTITSTPLLMENWADFASLVVGTDGQLWAQWFQRPPGDAGGHGYDGWFSRSADGGATWSSPAPLGHEFVALAPLSGGRVLAAWLESARKRDPNAPRAPKDPHAPYAPSMRVASRLLAPDGSTLQDWIVDPDVCTCCQVTLARLPGDRVVAAYRGHLPDETRDNQVALFDGAAWTTPKTLHPDGWKIPACPVNGPAADALGEQVAVTWFTAANGVARVQAKFSTDGGRTFGPALPVDLGRPVGRVDLVMLRDGSALVSWLEAKSAGNDAGLYVLRIFPNGAMSAPLLVAATSAVRASGFPRLAPRPGAGLPVVVTWTDAVPVDPANPKSAASTRVLTTLVDATGLTRAAPRANQDSARSLRPAVLLAADECAEPVSFR